MKVIKCNKKNDSYSFTVQATEEEVGVMINIALGALVFAGYIDEDVLEEEESFEYDLNDIPIEDFYKV